MLFIFNLLILSYITIIKVQYSQRFMALSHKQKANDATISLVRGICQRISQALQQIDTICSNQQKMILEPSSIGHFEGLGIFLYVKQNQQAMKKKYPAFTENQILNILLAQWQKLSNNDKLQYSGKFNYKQYKTSKKIKKLNKSVEKLLQDIKKDHDSNSKQNQQQQQLKNVTALDKQQVRKQIQPQYPVISQKQELFLNTQTIQVPKKRSRNLQIRNQINIQLKIQASKQISPDTQQNLNVLKEPQKQMMLINQHEHFIKNQELKHNSQLQLVFQQDRNQQMQIPSNYAQQLPLSSLNQSIHLSPTIYEHENQEPDNQNAQDLTKQNNTEMKLNLLEEQQNAYKPVQQQNYQNSFSFGQKNVKLQQSKQGDQTPNSESIMSQIRKLCMVKQQKQIQPEQTPFFSSIQDHFQVRPFDQSNKQ